MRYDCNLFLYTVFYIEINYLIIYACMRCARVDEADEASCASARVLCMLSKACLNCGSERKGRCKAMVLRCGLLLSEAGEVGYRSFESNFQFL